MFETVDVHENLFILYLIIPMATVTEIIMERYGERRMMRPEHK